MLKLLYICSINLQYNNQCMGINSISKLNDVTKYSNIMRYKCDSSRIILNYSKWNQPLSSSAASTLLLLSAPPSKRSSAKPRKMPSLNKHAHALSVPALVKDSHNSAKPSTLDQAKLLKSPKDRASTAFLTPNTLRSANKPSASANLEPTMLTYLPLEPECTTLMELLMLKRPTSSVLRDPPSTPHPAPGDTNPPPCSTTSVPPPQEPTRHASNSAEPEPDEK